MCVLAAHLVDGVLGDLPVRQWVLTLPHRLRYKLAYDHQLCHAVLAVFVRALLAFERRRARAEGIEGRGGAVTAIQRVGAEHQYSLPYLGGRGRLRRAARRFAAFRSGPDAADPDGEEPASPRAPPEDAAYVRPRHHPWADLLRRTFEFDILACPDCGGRLHFVATIEERAVIEKILTHLGLPVDPPNPAPARSPTWLPGLVRLRLVRLSA